MNKIKRLIGVLLLAAMIVPMVSSLVANAATTYISKGTGSVTVAEFDKALQKATGKKSTFISKSFGIKDTSKAMTNLQASQLIYNAYRYKEGTTVPKSVTALYNEVVNGSIISDATKVDKTNRKYVRYAYVWGIMEGTSYGDYTKKRTINYNSKTTRNEANLYCQRIADPKLRAKLTTDGQLIRTTNLPKNYKNYEYILANVPNSYYEMPFIYDLGMIEGNGKYSIPVNYKHTTLLNFDRTFKKSTIWSTIENWDDSLLDNIKLRFNVNYKTIGKQWKSDVNETYWVWRDKNKTQDRLDIIDDYINYVKKNKLIISGTEIFTDTSTFYDVGNYSYARVHIKFKVSSDKAGFKIPYSSKFNDYGTGLFLDIESDSYFVKKLTLGKWYEFVVDVPVGQSENNWDYTKTRITMDGITDHYWVNQKSLYNKYKEK